MKLSLNTWERLMLIRIVGSLTGDARLYHKTNKILDVIEMTQKELMEIEFRQEGDDLKWDDVSRLWELEIKDRDAKTVIHLALRKYQGYKGRDRAQINPLWAKCDFSLPEEETP
jgi:hypothetical protein